jgi:ABC-type sugar transport system ATPase subunit
MRNGEAVWTGPICEASIPKLIRLMVGREVDELFPKQAVERGDEVLALDGLSCGGVVRDVSFRVHRGEIVGLAGLVGSGRTTLVRGLFGLTPIRGGTIRVKGRALVPRHPADAIAAGVALIPENRQIEGLAVDMTLASNVTMASPHRIARTGWLSHERERELARRYIGELNIATRGPDQVARTLSGGNQQKVVIAKWLCRNADVLLMDEPTRGIDVGAKAEVFRLMVELARAGKGIVMVSSYLPELLGMCDRLIVMFRGTAVADLPVAEATQERVLAYASTGSDAEGNS